MTTLVVKSKKKQKHSLNVAIINNNALEKIANISFSPRTIVNCDSAERQSGRADKWDLLGAVKSGEERWPKTTQMGMAMK